MIILSRKDKPNKVVSDYTLNDVYTSYLSNFDFPKTKSKYLGDSTLKPVSKQLFRAINVRLYELIFEAILYKSLTFVLPYKLGELRVQKKPMPISFLKDRGKLKMDYKYWRETGKLKYHLNEHRNYHRYKIYWAYADVANVRTYRFEPIRKWHRLLSNILHTQPSIDYFE